jgi:hypothetical protein
MSKLTVITAPISSTAEERKAEEERVKKILSSPYVICLLEGWRVETIDVHSPAPRGMVK